LVMVMVMGSRRVLGMIASMKAPVIGILIAGAVAVLPTAIIAHLAAAPDQVSEKPTNTPAEITEPATRPSRSSGAAASGSGGGLFAGEGRNRPGLIARRPEATPEEIQAAIDFFKVNSPNRMAYFDRLRPGSPARSRQSLLLVQFYRPILAFRDSNPQLYDLLVQQVKLRDDAFELAKDKKDTELQQKAAEIVRVSIDARTLRLDFLKKQLADQQTRLDYDRDNQVVATQHEVSDIKISVERLMNAVDRAQTRERNQSMLDLDPSFDPLAEAAPIFAAPIVPDPADGG